MFNMDIMLSLIATKESLSPPSAKWMSSPLLVCLLCDITENLWASIYFFFTIGQTWFKEQLIKLWGCSESLSGCSAMGSQLFAQSFIQAMIKENTKAPRHWLSEGKIPVNGGFAPQRASNAGNDSIWWRHHVFPDFGGVNVSVSNIRKKMVDVPKENRFEKTCCSVNSENYIFLKPFPNTFVKTCHLYLDTCSNIYSCQ